MEWSSFSTKKILVIFEDGQNHFSRKEGWFIEATTTHLIIRCEDKREAINLQKVLRVAEIV